MRVTNSIFFCSRNEPNDLKIICCDGIAFQRNQMYPFLHEWIDEFFEFSNRLHAIVNMDLSSFACISALALLRPDLDGIEDKVKLEKIRVSCHGWLFENCRTQESVCDRQGYLAKVLSVLDFVHTVSIFFCCLEVTKSNNSCGIYLQQK